MREKSEDFFMRNSELSMEFSNYFLEHSEIDEFLTEERVIIFLSGKVAGVKSLSLTNDVNLKDLIVCLV